MGTALSVLLYCIKRFHSSKFRHSSTNPDHVSISPDEGDRPSLGESEVDVEMKRCAAYQVVQPKFGVELKCNINLIIL